MSAKCLVGRVSRNGHHYYSVLADDQGFEFIFRNGHDRWSTISQPLAKKILLRNDQKIAWYANKAKAHLRIASKGILVTQDKIRGWEMSKPIKYSSRDNAVFEERLVLDLSWAKAEKGNSDEE